MLIIFWLNYVKVWFDFNDLLDDILFPKQPPLTVLMKHLEFRLLYSPHILRPYYNVHAILAVILNIIIGNRSKSNVIYDRPLPLDISLLCIVLARRPWLHYGFPPSQNTIDVFFDADMGLFYQRNEPQDPYITYRVSHVKLDFFSRFYSIFTKYNWCILWCWHWPLLSKKWATRPLHCLQCSVSLVVTIKN